MPSLACVVLGLAPLLFYRRWDANGLLHSISLQQILHAVYCAGIKLRTLTQNACPQETAAIIIEPIMGEGGFLTPPPGFLAGLRKICDREGMLLIIDEVCSHFLSAVCQTLLLMLAMRRPSLPPVTASATHCVEGRYLMLTRPALTVPALDGCWCGGMRAEACRGGVQ